MFLKFAANIRLFQVIDIMLITFFWNMSKIIVFISKIRGYEYTGVTFAVIGQGNAVSGDNVKPEIHSNKK